MEQNTTCRNWGCKIINFTNCNWCASRLDSSLFIMYINDFSQASPNIHFLFYADDITLSRMSNFTTTHNDDPEGNIYEELYKINEWLDINNLSLNATKSKFIVFHMQKTYTCSYSTVITKADNLNFLGLTLEMYQLDKIF